jgi:hypothetical protein
LKLNRQVLSFILVAAATFAHGQNREYGPGDSTGRAFPMYDMNRSWPNQNPAEPGSLYTSWVSSPVGHWAPSSNTSETVKSVLVEKSASIISAVYVLADVQYDTGTSIPRTRRRDYAMHKIGWSSGSLAEASGGANPYNIYDFGSHSDYTNNDPDTGQVVYRSDGLDRLGGGVLDTSGLYFFTVGTCNNDVPSNGNQEFTVSRWQRIDLANVDNQIVATGADAAEGNAIAIDPVRNRLFVAGARTVGGVRDILLAEYNLNLSNWPMVGSPVILTRTGDDVAYYLKVQNISSTSTRVFVSGTTNTVGASKGSLTFKLTESNSGTWVQNWSCAVASTMHNGNRNDGMVISNDGADVYLVSCEGDIADDYWTTVYHINGNGSGTISPTWSKTFDAEITPGNLRTTSENVDGGYDVDSSGNFWISYDAYRDLSNSVDIRVAAISNTGTQLVNYLYSTSGQEDRSLAGIFGGTTTQFYALGTTPFNMYSGAASFSGGLTMPWGQPYPYSNTWSAATNPWYPGTGTLPLTGRPVSGMMGSSGYPFSGTGGRIYNYAIAAVRPGRAAMDDWPESTEDNSEIRKYRYHAFDVTMLGANY